jgi:hypothetical protein
MKAASHLAARKPATTRFRLPPRRAKSVFRGDAIGCRGATPPDDSWEILAAIDIAPYQTICRFRLCRRKDGANCRIGGEANIMTRVPAAVGVCAIILLGLAMSACARGGDNSRANGDCQPGICVGSTPGSTPETLMYLAP